jgi:transcription elongation factor B subunit 2
MFLKTAIFTDTKELSIVFEMKHIVEGVLKWPQHELQLYKEDQFLDDGKTLGKCGFTSQTAPPQVPATLGLAFWANHAFEALSVEPISSPPELTDVMRPQNSGGSTNEQAVQWGGPTLRCSFSPIKEIWVSTITTNTNRHTYILYIFVCDLYIRIYNQTFDVYTYIYTLHFFTCLM